MNRIQTFLHELNQESETTRNMLKQVPDDKYDWKPHAKSMTIRQLSTHIAELPSWISMGLKTDELDFATAPYEPKQINSTAELMVLFEDCLIDGCSELLDKYEDRLNEKWILRTGEQIHQEYTKASVIRMVLSQIIHHRAQLGVFLRLLDVPIPGSYGPSADSQGL